MTEVLDNSRVSKHLGQTSEYKDQYDRSLLVREPRCNNREHLQIKDDNLPFVGYDTWNAYEVSGLTHNGLPVASVAKIVYPCSSKYIVESKSIKLYFNSFNMYKCGNTPREVAKYISKRAEEDLSALLETNVRVNLEASHAVPKGDALFSPDLYPTLEKIFNEESLKDLNINTYVESPGLLEIYESDFSNMPGCCYHSSLLKSNCRVTSQPDWGDVYIYIKGSRVVDPTSLLEYIISFRDECHFHEEICETIYKRLMDIFQPEQLCVTCLYARRGGIDINPVRASHEELINSDLINPEVMHVKTGKQ
tara:strand:- start:328 stop:1248 length:921 start_codon:yes stop_codon:yes gene_type:complete